MESAVSIYDAFVPIGDFRVVHTDGVFDAAEHLVWSVCVIDEECVGFACGLEGVVGEHACDADVAARERERTCSHGLEDYRGRRLLQVCRKQKVRGGKRVAQFFSVVRFFGIELEDADEVAVLVRNFLVVVPFGVFWRNAHDDKDVLFGDVRKDGRKRFGSVARLHVHVAVNDKLVRKIHVELAAEARLGDTLRFFDGTLGFVVEVPELVVHAELDAEELAAVAVQESAETAGEVRIEHGVAIARRREQHLVGVQDACLEEADLAPELVAVHVEVLARETDFFDFARLHMEVVSDVMDVEEKRDVVESFLVDGVAECADEGSAPFMTEDCLELDAALRAVRKHCRGEHGESQVVVAVREGVRRSVNVGPTEIFLIIYIGVEWVVIGTPDLERLVLQRFDALINAMILVGIDNMVFIEWRTSNNLRTGVGKSLRHAVYCGREGARYLPVPRFWSYDEYIHWFLYTPNKNLPTKVSMYKFIYLNFN